MAYINPASLMLDPQGPGSSYHYAVVSNPPLHPSTMRTEMPQYWILPDRRRVEHLPRPPQYCPSQESIPPITFTVNGWPGVRVKDLLRNQVTVDCPYDTPLVDLKWRQTVINLEWPGYARRNFSEPQSARIDVMSAAGPITRQGLAAEVAGMLRNYWQSAKMHQIAPEWQKWTLSDQGIRPSDVVLLSIHYYRNQWIPEFYVFE